MPPNFSEDEIDDLIYFARAGENSDLHDLMNELCVREGCQTIEFLQAARDVDSGNGVIHMAAANGHSALLAQLLTALSIPIATTLPETTHPATTTIQNPALTTLLNTQNWAGSTPLHWACLNGHLECVKLLVDNGADPTITNNVGHDPVYEAELNDRKDVVEWVLREGGDGLETGLGGEALTGQDEEGGDETDEEDAAEQEENPETIRTEGDLQDAPMQGVCKTSSEYDLRQKLHNLGVAEAKEAT